jgi:hypothetical protein
MAFETCLNYAWSKYLKGNKKHGLRIGHVEFVLLVLIDSKGWPGLQRPGLAWLASSPL